MLQPWAGWLLKASWFVVCRAGRTHPDTPGVDSKTQRWSKRGIYSAVAASCRRPPGCGTPLGLAELNSALLLGSAFLTHQDLICGLTQAPLKPSVPLPGLKVEAVNGCPRTPRSLRGSESVLTEIKLKKGESVEKALRRLKKKIEREGVLKEVRNHRHYEKPNERRRRRMKMARFSAMLSARYADL